LQKQQMTAESNELKARSVEATTDAVKELALEPKTVSVEQQEEDVDEEEGRLYIGI
jgi:hypothetical protein